MAKLDLEIEFMNKYYVAKDNDEVSNEVYNEIEDEGYDEVEENTQEQEQAKHNQFYDDFIDKWSQLAEINYLMEANKSQIDMIYNVSNKINFKK